MGYSGDDRPSLVMSSHVGVQLTGELVFGDLALSRPRAGLEIKPVMSAVQVLDVKLLESLLNYATRQLDIKWTDYPVLLVESPQWESSVRETLASLFFDTFEVPAVYFGPTAVLAAFAQGKHNALVVDMGAAAVRVAPVHDGMMERGGCLSEPFIGGNSLSQQVHILLEERMKIPLHIYQEVVSKMPVPLGKPAIYEARPLEEATESFLVYHQRQLCDDFKESMVQINEAEDFDKHDLAMRPTKFYEFPDGFNQSFGLERYQLGEMFFHPSTFRFDPPMEVDPSSKGDGALEREKGSLKGLAEMIRSCAGQVDGEYRRDAASNVIITGGASSVHGLSERLTRELGPVRLGGDRQGCHGRLNLLM